MVKSKKKDIPTYKKFGGKDYELEGYAPNKRDATARVKRLRGQGHPARFIYRDKTYCIYIHMRQRKKPAKPKYKKPIYKRGLKGYKKNPFKR